RSDLETDGGMGARKAVAAGNGFLTERALKIAAVVQELAAEAGTTPSRVALAWTLLNPAVVSSLVGARTLAQLKDNLGALEIELDTGQRARLDEVSAVDPGFPHDILGRLAASR
ncbi:aldo/keto reductase, partial [Nonomuraea rubra]